MSADFDDRALERWVKAHVPKMGDILGVEKFEGGQSNPTYKIIGSGSQFALRRKPFGTLLPSAHAIEREYKLLTALHPMGYPVPEPLGICEDSTVIGASFYLMEMVWGRNFRDASLPGVEKAESSQLYHSMIETLARLHMIDIEAAGLGKFGKPGGYCTRQIKRWTAQYRASQTDDLPEVEKLIEWLPKTVPAQKRNSIIHGDYRMDNLIFGQESADVAAVLDWELGTLGDPTADLAYLLMNWIMPPMGPFGIGNVDHASTGIPSMSEAVEIYCSATGLKDVPNLGWYFAFNLFRLTGIAQGIKKRLQDGNASGANAGTSAALVESFARLAWEQAQELGA